MWPFTITAKSVADPSKTATVNVTLYAGVGWTANWMQTFQRNATYMSPFTISPGSYITGGIGTMTLNPYAGTLTRLSSTNVQWGWNASTPLQRYWLTVWNPYNTDAAQGVWDLK